MSFDEVNERRLKRLKFELLAADALTKLAKADMQRWNAEKIRDRVDSPRTSSGLANITRGNRAKRYFNPRP